MRLPFILSTCLALVATAHAEPNVLVADFNAPAPNNLQGNYGAFAPTASEVVFVCKESQDIFEKRGGDGSSLRLDYNVGNGGAYNGLWMKLGPADSGNAFDASSFTKLSFWAKGDKKAGIPHKFKVELKGDPGTEVGYQYVSDISSSWGEFEIDLKDYVQQGVDLSKLNEMVIVFEQRAASPAMEGTLFIDDVRFR